jgi:hypothetical protein
MTKRLPGVMKCSYGQNLWEARIKERGRMTSLGVYTSEIHASLAFLLRAEKTQGERMKREFRDLLDANRHLIPEIESKKRKRRQPKCYSVLPSGRFAGQITFRGRNIHLGTFDTEEEVKEAVREAIEKRDRLNAQSF